MVPAIGVFPAIEKGNPIAVFYPEDGCGLCVGPSFIPAAAPHRHKARLFLNWMLTAQYARLAVERGSEATHQGIAPAAGRLAVNELPLMRLSIAEIRKDIAEVVEHWRETFGG